MHKLCYFVEKVEKFCLEVNKLLENVTQHKGRTQERKWECSPGQVVGESDKQCEKMVYFTFITIMKTRQNSDWYEVIGLNLSEALKT